MLRRRAATPPSLPRLLLAVALLLPAHVRCGGRDPRATIDEARHLRETGRPAEAATLLADLVQSSPRDFRARYELAFALHSARREKEALSEVGGAIEVDPSSADARVLRADVLSALGRDDEALSELRQVIAADPRRRGVHRRMGDIHAKAGRLDQTLNQFEKEIALNPQDVDTLTDIGIHLFQAGRLDEASEHLERAVALQPRSARARQFLGEVRLKQKRYSEGLALQKAALADDPSNVQALVNHAAALESYGDPHEVEMVLKGALARGLDDPRLHVQLGIHYRKSLQFDESAAALQRAIEIQPANAEAHFQLAKTYYTEARYDDALKEFREASRLAPSDPYGYTYYIGKIVAMQGKTDEAIGLFRRSLELDPANPKAHYALAVALQKIGHKEEAEREFAVHGELLRRLRESKREGVATAD